MKYIYIVFILLCSFGASAQKVKPYQIYDSKGKKVSFEKMIRKIEKSDVVLFGEFHNNSIGHWLQLKVAKVLSQNRSLVLGAEMFEADNQEQLNAYFNGEISEADLSKHVRLWNNYETDYKPLVDFAKTNKLPFIATNVPRRFASQVYKKGLESLDSLSVEEKSWMPPLPIPYDSSLPGYKKMLTMFDDEHVNNNLPKAQAIKDAAMGYFIGKNYIGGSLVLHFNGSYHSNNYEGIFWYLNNYYPTLHVSTITMVEQDDVNKLFSENLNLANFIIVIDSDILKTF